MMKIKYAMMMVIVIALASSITYSQTALPEKNGCCINPGAGDRACSFDRLVRMNQECCPLPQSSFPSYYQSQQNPNGPASYEECTRNFFFERACDSVRECSAAGCCCSSLGNTFTSEIRCTGTGVTFKRGETNCQQACPPAQCTGDNCNNQGTGDPCLNPNYVPRLTNLQVRPGGEQKKFMLSWQDECRSGSTHYEILACKGNGCSNFDLVGTSNSLSFEDASLDLLFGEPYNYMVKSHYSLQSATPSINKTASLGNPECIGRGSNVFCFNNSAFACDDLNKLNSRLKCLDTQVCRISSNSPSCISKGNCDTGNPFGLFASPAQCESSSKYCFYDKSKSLINYCFACDPSMSCYDYKSQSACASNACGLEGCSWRSLQNEIGSGVCVSTKESNCKWCSGKGTPSIGNILAFNNIFDICTKAKSDALSVPDFKCYFGNSRSNSCNEITCRNYDASQCRNGNILHDELNIFTNPSSDECGIKACQNIGNSCVKNADGDNAPDCTTDACERDFIPPNTSLIPIGRQGITESILINVYDREGLNSSLNRVSSYTTYLCLEPCGQQGHPYAVSTTSNRLLISGLSLFDGGNLSRIITLQEGTNTLRFYSQDNAKNIEKVKRITIEARRVLPNPIVAGINVSDSSKVNNKFYTAVSRPFVTVHFVDPAIITYARLVNRNTSTAIQFQISNALKPSHNVTLAQDLPDGEYTIELNAKNQNNLMMNSLFTATMIVDSTRPTVNITPINNAVISTIPFEIRLGFSEEVVLESVKLGGIEIKNNFSTTDKRMYATSANSSDGNKALEIIARDYASNQVSALSEFAVDAYPTEIILDTPRNGISSLYTFNIIVKTDNNQECRYELDDNLDFNSMSLFSPTNGIVHTIHNFNGIQPRDNSTHTLHVKCKDSRRGITSKQFNLSVDDSAPKIKSAYAYPNPVMERPIITYLTVETDKAVICKYSPTATSFAAMENKFFGFDNETFLNVSRQNVTLGTGSSSFNVACMSKSQLVSDTKRIDVSVDLSRPLVITSHTPSFFNGSPATLSVETSKLAQCKYYRTDQASQSGSIFGAPSYSHTIQLTIPNGNHSFFVICKDQHLQQWSSPVRINFAIDATPPVMLFVNDSSTLNFAIEKTCNKDRLRVKFLAEDTESGIKNYSYSIIKDNQPIAMNETYLANQWLWLENLTLQENAQYFFRVMARNFVGMQSNPKTSDGITIDPSVCLPAPKCQDTAINQPGEECDKTAFGAISSCLNYTNFVGGQLKCNENCRLDISSCTRMPDCGNGKLDPGEACDSNLFGGISACANYSTFSGGQPKCSTTCQLDTSSCIEKPKCGNGVIDLGENCDGTNLGPISGRCIDYNPSTFTGGNIACNSCKLDTSACQGVQGTCGNGIINIGEACDGTNLGQINACANYSRFSGGTPTCSSDCKSLDTSSCTEKPKCGNGIVDLGESCDTNNFGPLNGKCIDYSGEFNGGDLKCTGCKLDSSSCSRAPTCGNNRIDIGETCDGTKFKINDLNCGNYSDKFGSGQLVCSDSCTLTTRNCVSNVTVVSIATCKDYGNCTINDPCTDNSDCKSRFCASSKCQQASCSDGIKNQDETAIDCGGACAKCPAIINPTNPNDATIPSNPNDPAVNNCKSNSDCQSGYCDFGTCKTRDICTDGLLSPGETDTDCGGFCPTKCGQGESCEANEDCNSGLACSSLQCKSPEQPQIQQTDVIDSDGDGMPDDWEAQNGLRPDDSSDAEADDDNDGLTNLDEFRLKETYGSSTDPHNLDSDGDGFGDGDEIKAGTSPLDETDYPKSSKLKIILFVLGAVALLGGFGYLGYSAMQRRKESEFGGPQQREFTGIPSIPRQAQQQRMQPYIGRQNPAEQARIREAMKARQMQIDRERKNLFGTFGAEKPAAKEAQPQAKTEQKQESKPESSKTPAAKKQGKAPTTAPRKSQPGRSDQDVFGKLKEIANESKSKRARKNAK